MVYSMKRGKQGIRETFKRPFSGSMGASHSGANTRKKAMDENLIHEHIGTILNPDSSTREKDESTLVILAQFRPLMNKWASYYTGCRNDIRDTADFEGAAKVALVKSIYRFQPTAKVKFITFLTNGLRNELIVIFRRYAKLGSIEPVNLSSYFHYQDTSGSATFPFMDTMSAPAGSGEEGSAEGRVDCEVTDFFTDQEDNLDLTHEILEELDLTLNESLYLLMTRGWHCKAYSQKDIRKYFKLNRIHLENAERKVTKYLTNKWLNQKED